jgi:signal transduction histidine kinase/tetratricopeptide (TPR) repeat protein
MSMLSWLSPPRRLMALFLAVTLAPAAGLVWLGWGLLEQDRDLETQREMERREYAADKIVSALQQEIRTTRQALADPARMPEMATEDSIVIVFNPSELVTHPASGLLYRPVVRPEPEAPGRPFMSADRYEFREMNYARAVDALLPLARSDDAAVRAGAYLRLGRNYRKAGDIDRALAAYEALSHIEEVRIAGVPAGLAARSARCSALAQLGRLEDLRNEALSLSKDLFGGRWQMTKPVFELHAAQVRTWLDSPEQGPDGPLALSEAVEWLWERWRAAQTGGPALAEFMTHESGGQAFTMVANPAEEQPAVFVAGPDFTRRQWLAAVDQVLEGQGVEISLRDGAGNTLLGTPPPRLDQLSLRLSADTGLPWSVIVSSREAPADSARFTSRRRLLMSALGLVLLLVLASTYFVARSVSRELAAARLKSDFVSAVSHEFRTPLATLRQLTENLADGRVGGEERRLEYYGAQLRATWRLSRLVERLLDFGRMEAGALRFRPEPVGLGELVRSVIDEFESVSATSGHHIDLTVEAGLPPVSADREALAQAVWNLLDNAIKYSPGRPVVWIEVGREDSLLAIRVRDEGPGLPAEDLKGLFRKFVRGSAARDTGVKGTGIGLAMVDYTVRAHGGSIRVDSSPGEGSTFTILLETEES